MYPITSDEVKNYLERDIKQELASEAIGGTKAICYQHLLEFVNLNKNSFDQFLDIKSLKGVA